MTDINGEHTITEIVAGDEFKIVIALTGQTYSSGGTAKKCVSMTGWTLDLASEVINITDSSNASWEAFISTDFSLFTFSLWG